MPTSTLRWLDHDTEQARRSAELVRALSEPDTVDSLGVGAIRDGFANLFFPGTSTIQTRVRYFLLTPWALQQTAARRPRDRAQYDRFLNDIETATITSLMSGNPGELGIIGRQRGRNTKRKAVSVYWTGIGEWGIRVADDLTMSGYRSYVLTRRGHEGTDGDVGDGVDFQVWDEMPRPPEFFPELPIDILPTATEAEYLLSRMSRTTPGGRGHGVSDAALSLLAGVAKEPHTADADWLWDLPASAIPEGLATAVGHAELFSLAIQGARLRYLQLLFAAQRREGLPPADGEPVLEVLVQDWVQKASSAIDELRTWVPELPELFDLLRRFGTHVGEPTRRFVTGWCRAAIDDPADAMRSDVTAARVTERELLLKSPNARLAGGSALRAWDGSLFGASQLDYRWSVAQRMIRDCRTGMETDNAGA